MKRSERLVLLFLGLCFLHLKTVKTQGDCPFDSYDRMMERLKEIETEVDSLRTTFASSTNGTQRINIERDLHRLVYLAVTLKEACKHLHKEEIIIMTPEQREIFTKKKEILRNKLMIAEGLYGAARSTVSENQRSIMRDVYRDRLNLATEVRDKIAKEYEELTESGYVEEIAKAGEKEQVLLERSEMMEKLRSIQDLHSRTLEAMAVTIQEGYRPVDVPHQDEINELRSNIQALVKTYNKEQLLKTKTKLEDLLQELYEESQLPPSTELRDLEKELTEMELDTIRQRDQENERRKDILRQMMKTNLVDYDEKGISSLQEANQQVVSIDKDMQEIARRNAYFRSISRVVDLVKECSYAIEFRDRIEEMKSSDIEQKSSEPLLKEKYEEADSDFGVDVQAIPGIIHEKGLLLKQLHDLFRTRINTEIINGLGKVNKILPISFGGCDVTRFVKIRDTTREWVNRVKYALRLSKDPQMNDSRDMNLKMCLAVLGNMRDALVSKISGKIQKESNPGGDEEATASEEKFEMQDRFDVDKHFKYIDEHLNLLNIEAERDEERLKKLRFHFISVKKVPAFLEDTSQKMLKELHGKSSQENIMRYFQNYKAVLKEVETTERRLSKLFDTLVTKVKFTIEKQEHEYRLALEENKRCQNIVFKQIALFGPEH